MRRAKGVGEAVLVHCHAGMQRSAGSVALYLIAIKGLTADDAMAAIKAKRPITFTPRANFERAIRGFEAMFTRDIKPRLA
jgi:protein-tyrosine phosphatase